MAKCLVSGCAGFIGSHLCERLIADGHEVIGIDSLITGRQSNLDSIINNSNFHFYSQKIHPAFRYNVDWVFHLAALADVVPSIEDPWAYHEANVHATVALLESSRRAGVKKFIYAASSSCYGIPKKYPTSEIAPCKPMYPYALTKYLGEQYVMHWAKTYKLPAISLRLFNVYGPRARTNGTYGAVFGTFLAQLANNKPVTVVGDGTQGRDFTYITDVVDAFVKAAESDVTHEKINICTGICETVNHLVALLGAEAVHIPDRPGEPKYTQGNNAKALKLLGWSPATSFFEGVMNMKEIVNEYKDAPVWDAEKIEVATKPWFEALK